MKKAGFLLTAALAPYVVASSAHAAACTVVDGVVADVAQGPFMPSVETVTLKAAYKAEFRWNPIDPESIGWMRIVDETGREVGWVPAGHEGVRCGENH